MRIARIALAAALAAALLPSAAFAQTGSQADTVLTLAAQDGDDPTPLYTGTCGDNAVFEWYEDGRVVVHPEQYGQPCSVNKALYTCAYLESRDPGWWPTESWVFENAEHDVMDIGMVDQYAHFMKGLLQGASPQFIPDDEDDPSAGGYWTPAVKATPIRDLIIEDGVTDIEGSVFALVIGGGDYDVSTLRSVVFPEHMHCMGNYSFSGGYRYNETTDSFSFDRLSVVLPKTVEVDSIGTFYEVEIPEATLPIVTGEGGEGVFSQCLKGSRTFRLAVPEGIESFPASQQSDWELLFPRSLEWLELPSTCILTNELDTLQDLKILRMSGDFVAPTNGKNLFTQAFIGDVHVYYPWNASGYVFGKAHAVAEPGLFLGTTPTMPGAPEPTEDAAHVSLIALPDFDALPDPEDVTLADKEAIRTGRDFLSIADPDVVYWAGDRNRLLAAEAVLDMLELDSLKEDAKAQLQSYADLSAYRPVQAALVAEVIEEGKTAIDAAATGAAVRSALALAERAIDDIPNDVTLSELELASAQESARAELRTYVDTAAYRKTQAEAISEIVSSSAKAINAATACDEVASILASAKARIDALPTDAQLSAAELVSAKEQARALISSYRDPSPYRAAEKKKLADAVARQNALIDAATSPEAVAKAFVAGKKAIDALEIKTDAQLAAEEKAAKEKAAKEKAAKEKAAKEKAAKEKAAAEKKAAEEKAAREKAEAEKKAAEEKAAKEKAAKKVAKGKSYKVSGQTYKVTKVATAKARGAVKLVKAKNAKGVTVPAAVKLADGRKYNVTRIAKGAFKSSKATKVTVKAKKLKKASVKGCLKGSKVKTVKVPKAKLKAYKKIFTKANAGKKVVVK